MTTETESTSQPADPQLTLPDYIKTIWEKTEGHAWVPAFGRDHPTVQRLVEEGWVKHCVMRSMFEAMDTGVEWTLAAQMAVAHANRAATLSQTVYELEMGLAESKEGLEKVNRAWLAYTQEDDEFSEGYDAGLGDAARIARDSLDTLLSMRHLT